MFVIQHNWFPYKMRNSSVFIFADCLVTWWYVYIVGFMTVRLLIQPNTSVIKFVLNLLLQKERKRKKLTQAERREQARQEEERLRAVEQKLINSETSPQSADDFDRLVLSSPNSSLCWIKYMAFHLQVRDHHQPLMCSPWGHVTTPFPFFFVLP